MLLLPTGYYLIGGALAVAASFWALAFVRPATLERYANARWTLFEPTDRGRFATSLLSFVVLLALIAAGFLGSHDPLANPLPLVVWTLLWVGLTLVARTDRQHLALARPVVCAASPGSLTLMPGIA